MAARCRGTGPFWKPQERATSIGIPDLGVLASDYTASRTENTAARQIVDGHELQFGICGW